MTEPEGKIDRRKGHYEIRDRYAYTAGGNFIDLAGHAPTFNVIEYWGNNQTIKIAKMVVWVEDDPT